MLNKKNFKTISDIRTPNTRNWKTQEWIKLYCDRYNLDSYFIEFCVLENLYFHTEEDYTSEIFVKKIKFVQFCVPVFCGSLVPFDGFWENFINSMSCQSNIILESLFFSFQLFWKFESYKFILHYENFGNTHSLLHQNKIKYIHVINSNGKIQKVNNFQPSC